MTDEILHYQEIDGKLLKIEKEFAALPERRKAVEMQNVLKESQSKVVMVEKNAQKTVENFGKAKAYYDDLIVKIETLSKSVDESNLEKIKELQKAKNNFYMMLDKLEKELVKINAQLNMVAGEYNTVIKNAKIAKNNLEILKNKMNEQRNVYEPQIAKLKAELGEQEKKVDKKILDIYKAKRESKFPVIVKMVGSTCGGCRMAISASKMQKFEKDGYMECENCGRIIAK